MRKISGRASLGAAAALILASYAPLVSGCGGSSAPRSPPRPVGAISRGIVDEITLKGNMSDEGYGFQTGAAEENGITKEGLQPKFDSIGYKALDGSVSSWWIHIDQEVEKDLAGDGLPPVVYFVGHSDGSRNRAYGVRQDPVTGTRYYGLEELVGEGQAAYNALRDTVTY